MTDPAESLRTASADVGAVPAGLPVTAARGAWDHTADPRAASATVTGDSVVLTYISSGGCGYVFEPSAGLVGGVLVVTDVGRAPAGVGGCSGPAYPGGVPVRLAIAVPARGRLAVVLRERWGAVSLERLRGSVTLP